MLLAVNVRGRFNDLTLTLKLDPLEIRMERRQA
jgi:hypothetical protein